MMNTKMNVNIISMKNALANDTSGLGVTLKPFRLSIGEGKVAQIIPMAAMLATSWDSTYSRVLRLLVLPVG